MSEEIIEYVKKNPASRYGYIHDHFRQVKRWSGGKWSYQWGKAKKNLTKDFDSDGKPRYFVRDARIVKLRTVEELGNLLAYVKEKRLPFKVDYAPDVATSYEHFYSLTSV